MPSDRPHTCEGCGRGNAKKIWIADRFWHLCFKCFASRELALNTIADEWADDHGGRGEDPHLWEEGRVLR